MNPTDVHTGGGDSEFLLGGFKHMDLPYKISPFW